MTALDIAFPLFALAVAGVGIVALKLTDPSRRRLPDREPVTHKPR